MALCLLSPWLQTEISSCLMYRNSTHAFVTKLRARAEVVVTRRRDSKRVPQDDLGSCTVVISRPTVTQG